MALPATVPLVVYRGDTWSQVFRFLSGLVPVNLTGATVQAQARNPAGTHYNLVATVTDPVNGQVTLSLPPGSLPLIPPLIPGVWPGASLYAYDLEVTLAGAVTTWVAGTLTLIRDVTNELP
jgi:hypothetical protein